MATLNHSRLRPPPVVLAWLVIQWRLTDVQIAELCGVTDKTVRLWRQRYGLVRPERVHVSKETLIDLYQTQGLSKKEVGSRIGRSESAVGNLMRRYGIPSRGRGRPVGSRRATDNQEHRAAYEADPTMTVARLAAEHHLPEATMYARLKAAGTQFRRTGPAPSRG